jgi:hypothetical protein
MRGHHSSGNRGIRHHLHSGRDNVFYLYEEPECLCNGIPCQCPDTGALTSGQVMRTNPIPAGRYWVDVFGFNIPLAAAWFKGMSGLGVHVNATEHFPSTEVPEVRDWYLFTYTPVNGVPVVWDQKTFGFLTIAGPEVKSSADTASTPPLPLDPLNELETFAESVGALVGVTSKAGAIALTGGLFIGAGYLLFELIKEKRRGKR